MNPDLMCNIFLYLGSLKHILGSAVKFIGSAICPKNTKVSKIVKEELTALVLPLLFSKSAEFLGEIVGTAVDPTYAKTDAPLNSKLVELLAAETLKAICSAPLRAALKDSAHDTFIQESLNALLSILLSTTKDAKVPSCDFDGIFLNLLSSDTGKPKLLLSLLDLLMTTKDEKVLTKICDFLSTLLSHDMCEKDAKKFVSLLYQELKNFEELPQRIFSAEFLQVESVVEAVCKFFSSLITLAGKHQEHKIIPNLLSKTIEVVKNNVSRGKEENKKNHLSSFEHVLQVIIQMASMCDSEEGHAKLFQQMTEWLYDFTEDVETQMNAAIDASVKSSMSSTTVKKSGSTTSTTTEYSQEYPTLQAIMTIMEYMLDVGKTLQSVAAQNPSLISIGGKMGQNSFQRLLEREQTPGTATPPNEIEDTFDLCESEIGDADQGDDGEESGGDDSDDEGLNGRLCTYTVTQKEFMSQHWYHCHTCGMVDGVGVCSICARVCHKGHDVTYAKFGSFFCDVSFFYCFV